MGHCRSRVKNSQSPYYVADDRTLKYKGMFVSKVENPLLWKFVNLFRSCTGWTDTKMWWPYKPPNVAVEWFTFLICIREVPASNLGPETRYFSIPPGKYRDSTTLPWITANMNLLICKWCGRKRWWTNLRYCTGISLECPKKITKCLSG
jgi:hypothetical protein